jgi:hypothetical protein
VTVYWKLAIILAGLLFQDYLVWHTRGKYDEAAQKAALEEQVKAADRKQSLIEAAAKTTEEQLLTERQKNAKLAKRWSVTRAAQTHTHCKLDADTLGLLREAAGAAPSDVPR